MENAERIIKATTRLLAEGGPDAVSTRAVSTAARVQPPTIYRLFGDKQGLLDAVAEHGFTTYLNRDTGAEPADDPVEDLRRGWDEHVELGLANPALYALMYRAPSPSTAARAAFTVLDRRTHRIAEAGRLRVPEPRATGLVHAAASGVTHALIATPEAERDPDLSRAAREAVIAAITTGPSGAPAPGPAGAAVALRASLPRTDALTEPERALLAEWLDRIAAESR